MRGVKISLRYIDPGVKISYDILTPGSIYRGVKISYDILTPGSIYRGVKISSHTGPVTGICYLCWESYQPRPGHFCLIWADSPNLDRQFGIISNTDFVTIIVAWWHHRIRERFKIIYFFVGHWDPWAMILMGPRALGMSPVIDFYSMEILRCIPRAQVVSIWWVCFEFLWVYTAGCGDFRISDMVNIGSINGFLRDGWSFDCIFSSGCNLYRFYFIMTTSLHGNANLIRA